MGRGEEGRGGGGSREEGRRVERGGGGVVEGGRRACREGVRGVGSVVV